MLTLRDVLQSKSSAIWSVDPQDSAYKAMEIMEEKNIGVLLVIEGEQVIGIISERDLARNIILKETPAREVAVKDLMTRDIYCVDAEKSVEECMGVMSAAHCRHLPVFENGRLVGLVTFADIVKALLVEQKVKIQDLENYTSCCDSVTLDED